MKQIRLSDGTQIEDINIARALAKYPELSSLKADKIVREVKRKDNRKIYRKRK